ncbi:hypothetical protein BGW39_006298, partial [Mortierella sp. 14UC]
MRFQSLLLLGIPAVMALVNAAPEPGCIASRPASSHAVARRGILDTDVYAAEPGFDVDLDLGPANEEDGSEFVAKEPEDSRRPTPCSAMTSKRTPKKTPTKSPKRKSRKTTTT